jgi:hypothetical protein
MKRGTWKQIERDWAEWLGGERIPVTGRHSGDVPDIQHHRFAIEVKAGKTISTRLRAGMDQAIKAAEVTGRTPLLCVTHNAGPGKPKEHYVIMRKDDFLTTLTDTGPQAPSIPGT